MMGGEKFRCRALWQCSTVVLNVPAESRENMTRFRAISPWGKKLFLQKVKMRNFFCKTSYQCRQDVKTLDQKKKLKNGFF